MNKHWKWFWNFVRDLKTKEHDLMKIRKGADHVPPNLQRFFEKT